MSRARTSSFKYQFATRKARLKAWALVYWRFLGGLRCPAWSCLAQQGKSGPAGVICFVTVRTACVDGFDQVDGARLVAEGNLCEGEAG